MGDQFHELEEQLLPVLRSGNLEGCETAVVAKLREIPDSPFHCVIDSVISSRPFDAAAAFDLFFERESSRMTIAAAYTEMNGFYINPNRWYCDLFAYSSYGGHADHDWLCHYQSEGVTPFVIRGMEPLQAVYASSFGMKSFEPAADLSSLLVVIKFQQFMRRAAAHMRRLQFPLLVTAHDFDFIAEFGPRPARP